MTEVAFSGEDHGDAVLVGGGDHLVVANAAARLDHRCHTRTDDDIEAVAEREEGVARARATGDAVTSASSGDAGRVDAVLLAGADAERLALAGQHDGIGRDRGAHDPGELEVLPLPVPSASPW